MLDYVKYIGDYKDSPVEIFKGWFEEALKAEENGGPFHFINTFT